MFCLLEKVEGKVLGQHRRNPNHKPYSPPEVDRIWGIWGSCYNIPKAIFYLLKKDYISIVVT